MYDATEPFLRVQDYGRPYKQRTRKIRNTSLTEEIENTMKKGFIIKIYGLLIFQVLITFAVCIFACYN